MSRIFKKGRPSPAMIVGVIALIAALGGGAYAATAKKVTYKGLDKDARLKVLPFSKGQAGTTTCDPTAAGTFTSTARPSTSTARPGSRASTTSRSTGPSTGVGGQLHAATAASRSTTLRSPVRRSGSKPRSHTADHGEGYGINVVTSPIGGKHAISVACNENGGDLKRSPVPALGVPGPLGPGTTTLGGGPSGLPPSFRARLRLSEP